MPLDGAAQDDTTNASESQAATGIGKVRTQFPQYNDLSDEQLAQGLHKKYYSDMPFDAFSAKIGFTPPKAAAPSAPMVPDNAVPRGDVPQNDEQLQDSPGKRILQAGVGGFKDAMDNSSLLSPMAQEGLDASQREGGWKGRLAQFGSTVAEDVGKAMTVPGAVFAGAQKGLNQFGEEIGVPGLGPAVGAFTEAFPQESMGMRGVLEKAPHLAPADRQAIDEGKAIARGAVPPVEPAPSPAPVGSAGSGRTENPAQVQPEPPTTPIAPPTATDRMGGGNPASPASFVRPEDEALAELEPAAQPAAATSPAPIPAAPVTAPASVAPVRPGFGEAPPPSPAGVPTPSVEPLPPATFGEPPPSPPGQAPRPAEPITQNPAPETPITPSGLAPLAANEHPGLVIQSLETGKQTTMQPPGTVKPGKWNPIGQNAEGVPVFEDTNGVRSTLTNGIRETESVQMTPNGPRVTAPDEKASQFQVVEGKPAEAQPSPNQVTEGVPESGAPPALDIPSLVEAHGQDGAMARVVANSLADTTKPPMTARDMQATADQVYGGKLSEGAYGRDRLYDAIELGVNRYIASDPKRFDVTADAPKAAEIATDLSQIKDRLPTQTVRAGEKDTHQQFSTPPDYAYAANWVAKLEPKDTVLEPSAGTGSLAVHAMNGAHTVITNELSDKRAAMLKDLNPTQIMREDATHINNTLPDDVKPTVVVMNPPFSAAPGRMANKTVLQTGANHVAAGLSALQDGGRLVAIVGRGMTMEAPAFKDWWSKIGGQYDVRANVGVGGAIYRKYGTNFGTRLLVIDKAPPSGRPIVGGEVGTASDLIGKLSGVRDERPGSPVEQVDRQPTSAPVATQGEGATGPRPELPSATGVLGAGERVEGGRPAEPKPADTLQPGGNDTHPSGERPEGGGSSEPVAAKQPEPVGARPEEQPAAKPAESDKPGGSSAVGAGDGVRSDGSGKRDEPGVTPAPETVVKTEAAVTDPKDTGVTEAVFENYKPQKLNVAGAKAHPGALVQSAAMASVDPPVANHALSIPKELIKKGALSDAQLEAVVYAGNAHADMLPDGTTRRGFFIGDGTGVGKGREVAGIILDNWMKGRQKALWVSEKMPLVNDARRDWTGLGQQAGDVIDHSKIKAGDQIPHQKGVLFTSYDTLKSAEQIKTAGEKSKGQTRIDQIVNWLGKDYDGVIAFDEAHNMGNSIDMKGDRGVKKAAGKALAGVELQKRLPNARVTYVSATGATEVSNLAYADRLGLWGQGTAFANREDFLSKIAGGGVAGMELVARDMKALGHYIARNLSYDGVEYNRLEHRLTEPQRGIYDKLAGGWQTVLQDMTAALADTGGDKNPKAKAAMQSAFWGAHQRFFNQIITSMQMPSVIKGVERDVKAGRQAVLQLVNTMEAAQGRALEKIRAAEGPEANLEDLDMTPRDQLMQMVERAYPTQVHEPYIDDNGNERTRPALDSEGNAIHDKDKIAEREQLLDELGSLKVPDGPLEMLMNHFGPDAVAEVTGRGQRVVKREDPETGRIRTIVEKRGGAANVADTNDFQSGKKKILVFSEAGGTGRSYHDAVDAPGGNSARRSHYLVQAGWQAHKAVQGFGRTHRTNQNTAPIFNLVTTDLQGQKRFISSIARRLGQLGALTKGERRAADQGMFSMRDNLESSEAGAALRQFFQDTDAGKVEGLTTQKLEQGMGLKLTDDKGTLRQDLPEMSQFLNRMLSLKIDDQNKVFGAFSDRLDGIIDRAAAAGTLDTGVEAYKADRIEKKSEQTVYTDPRSGAETKHVQLETQNKNYPSSFEDVALGRRGPKPSAWVQNNRSGRLFGVSKATDYTNERGEIVPQVRLTSPLDYQMADHADITAKNWTKIDDLAVAQQLWNEQVAKIPEYRKGDLHIITGAVLPIWDRIAGSPKIYRLQTADGERMLGRVIPKNSVDATLQRLGANAAKVEASPSDVAGRVMGGDTANLANGWKIKPSLVAGERRMELIGPDYRYDQELKNAGVFSERIAYKTRYFLPTGDKAAGAVEAITKARPVSSFGDTMEQGGKLYSFPAALFDPTAWRKALGLPAPSPKAAMEYLGDKQGLAKAAAEIKAGLSPTSMRGAAPMERAIREHTGRAGQAYDQTFHELDKVRLAVDQLSKADQVEFTDRMETGQKQPNPELQEVADSLRGQLDGWKTQIQGLGKGYLANAIEDYMGHIWGNYHDWASGNATTTPQTAMQTQAIARNVARQPLRGSGNFLKQRSFPTQKEGIAAGLIPVTYNPVDLQLIKIHELQKFYHGTVLADQLKAQGLAKFVREADQREAQMDGMVKLDDRVFQPKLYGASPIGPVDPGAYFAPEPMARIFNNYMSTGWHGQSVIYDGIRRANNALNSMQLGLSGFHAAFVLADTTISKFALGLQQMGRVLPDLAHGEFKAAGEHALRGIGNVAQGTVAGAPLAVTNTVLKGNKLRSAWLDPAGASPEMRQVVDAFKAAGGRMEMPEFFRTANAGAFYRTLGDLKNPQSALYQAAQMFRDAPTVYQKAVMTPLRIAGRLLDTMNQPLMGQLVPRAKMGVFSDLAQEWLRNNPGASRASMADAMIKIQDTVDNRLGQLNYDNLFWNKTAKDIAFITTRSVGWNLGTVREIGGSLVDAGRAITGNGGFTTRMAYTIALPIVTAQIGALMTYMATGRGPQSMLDYFYPPSASATPDGNQERRSIPGYMKDVIAFAHAPLQTIYNKQSPVLSTAHELLANQDYYGASIYDPQRDAGAPQAYADYLLNQAVPFGIRARDRLAKEGASQTDKAMAFWGFQPAPKSITQPGKGEAYQRREAAKAYKQRGKEPGRFELFNSHPQATTP